MNFIERIFKTSKEYKSNDKLVGELATRIDKEIPGYVKKVNHNLKMKNGKTKEVDIVTKKDIIEVKSGNPSSGGKSIGRQLRTVKSISKKEPIGYAPKLSKTEKDRLQREGFNVFWSDDALLKYLHKKKKPFARKKVVSYKEPYYLRRK